MTFVCNKCGIEHPITEYHKRSALKRGHDGWCKSCKSEYRKDYFKRNSEKEIRRGRIKAWKDAGIDISYDEYLSSCSALQNKCQICETNSQTLNVDHNHSTGRIRGYLCGSCNRALGLFKDSLVILEKAVKYLNDNSFSNS